jgi:hypothetical protein
MGLFPGQSLIPLGSVSHAVVALSFYPSAVCLHPSMDPISAGSCIFFFEAVTKSIEPYVRYWPYLLGDCLIYPLAYSSGAIISGLAQKHAIPNTRYSAENYFAFVEIVLGSLGRFVAPPLTRALLDAGGRNLYAAVQMGGLCISLATIYSHAGVIQRLEPQRHS